MPKKKPESLEDVVGKLLTLSEASEWIEEHKEEFGLAKAPNAETLKKSCYHKRLKAALKGQLYLTREQEVREYMKKYDPKNKSENRPLKPRALKKREAQATDPIATDATQDTAADE